MEAVLDLANGCGIGEEMPAQRDSMRTNRKTKALHMPGFTREETKRKSLKQHYKSR